MLEFLFISSNSELPSFHWSTGIRLHPAKPPSTRSCCAMRFCSCCTSWLICRPTTLARDKPPLLNCSESWSICTWRRTILDGWWLCEIFVSFLYPCFLCFLWNLPFWAMLEAHFDPSGEVQNVGNQASSVYLWRNCGVLISASYQSHRLNLTWRPWDAFYGNAIHVKMIINPHPPVHGFCWWILNFLLGNLNPKNLALGIAGCMPFLHWYLIDLAAGSVQKQGIPNWQTPHVRTTTKHESPSYFEQKSSVFPMFSYGTFGPILPLLPGPPIRGTCPWKRFAWLQRSEAFCASSDCALRRKVSRASWAPRRETVPELPRGCQWDLGSDWDVKCGCITTDVSMYVCMYVCMHACMHVCVYIYIIWRKISLYINMYLYKCTYINVAEKCSGYSGESFISKKLVMYKIGCIRFI